MQLQLVAPGRRCDRRARFTDYHRSGNPDLRDRLVKRHLPLARRLAARFARRGVPFEDLYQVASIGLIHAVDRFDPERGIPFEVFAAPTIVGEIKHHFRDRAWDVRIPRRIQELHQAVNNAADRLTTRLGRSPTVPELAREIGASEEEVIEAVDAGAAFNATSISGLISAAAAGSDRKVAHLLRAAVWAEDPRLARTEDRLDMNARIAELPARQQLIVRMYFWEQLSQDAIAARLGVSQMHVSRLLRRSVAQLHATLETDE